MSSKTDKQVVIVKLFKHLLADSNRENINYGDYKYDAFGYYDKIGFSIAETTDELIENTIDPLVGLEQMILLPVSERKLDWVNLIVGAITFIIIDEQKDTDLFSVAKVIEDTFYVDKMSIHAFVTMGASAIAIVAFCQDPINLVERYNEYFTRLQGYSCPRADMVYTFTTQFMDLERISKCNGEFDCVYMSFLWERDKVFYKETDKEGPSFVIEDITKALGTKHYKYGISAGTDDYYIYAEKVPAINIVTLFGENGILSSSSSIVRDCYGRGCKASFTSLNVELINTRAQGLCRARGLFVREDKPNADTGKEKTVENTNGVINLLEEVKNRIGNYAPARELLSSFRAFNELNASIYTRWVYRHYCEVVQLYSELMLKKLESDTYTLSNTIQDGYFFSRELNQMLEALLNTSAYFTDSPGFRKIEYNCLPRLLLCYQNRINELVSEWDNRSGDAARKHVFFLYAEEGNTVQASMLFRYLPPDRRLICVCVPIYLAYQPAVLIPLLLHEAGHYVGVRLRGRIDEADCRGTYRNGLCRKDIFIELVTKRFLVRLYCMIFRKNFEEGIQGFKKKKDYYASNTEKCENDIEDAMSIHALLAMNEEYDRLLSDIREAYDESKSVYLKQVNENGCIDPKQIFAIQKNYFTEMSAIVKWIFKQILYYETDRIYDIFSTHYALCMKQQPQQEHRYRELQKRTESRIRSVLPIIAEDLMKEGEKSFIWESERMLREVAADAFMVHVTRMKPWEYLCLVFEQYVYGRIELEGLINDFASMPAAYSRILGVYGYLCKIEGTAIIESIEELNRFESKRLETIAAISRKDKACIRKTYKEFKRWVESMLILGEKRDPNEWVNQLREMTYPVGMVREYIELIGTDNRYSNTMLDTLPAKEIMDIYRNACAAYEDGNVCMVDIYKQLY